MLAAVVALVSALGADAGLVALGTSLWPSTRHFVHFRVYDYATLTVIGVLVACVAWPVVTRASSTPRWLFFRLAVLVTLGLWLPDLWLLVRGEQARAVGILMAMHLSIALVAYNSLVRLAPARGDAVRPPGDAAVPRSLGQLLSEEKWPWVAMIVLVAVEFCLGAVSLFVVPFGRRSGFLPDRGQIVFLVHAGVGLALAAGAVLVMAGWPGMSRLARVSAVLGAAGILLGGAGGLLSLDHSLRLLGAGVMLLGALTAGTAYAIPTSEAAPAPSQAGAGASGGHSPPAPIGEREPVSRTGSPSNADGAVAPDARSATGSTSS